MRKLLFYISRGFHCLLSRSLGLSRQWGGAIRRCFRIRRYAHVEPVPILGNNCIAGRICHDLGWQFQSPTVNLFMSPGDFVRCVEWFICTGIFPEVHDVTAEFHYNYPVGRTETGAVVHFLHYKSFDEALKAWNRRSARLSRAKQAPILIVSDNANCSDEDLHAFLSLPFKKRMIVHDRRKADILGASGVFYPLSEQFGTNVSRQVGWTGRWLYQSLVPFSWLIEKNQKCGIQK